jgi:hypothetical protein
MSSVRMCDKCGDVFSEREQGWTNSEQTQIGEDENGRRTHSSIIVDLCTMCSPNIKEGVKQLQQLRRAARARQLELMAGDELDERLKAAEKEQNGS